MDRFRWSEHLATMAAPALVGTPLDPAAGDVSPEAAHLFLEEFADEFSHRRAVDRPLLGRMLGVVPRGEVNSSAQTGIREAARAGAGGGVGQRAKALSPDVALWWALHTGESAVEILGIASGVRTGAVVDDPVGPAPILGEAEFQRGAIEATTETELGALHALVHHARLRATPDRALLIECCLDAARWHVNTLQPDNGTNHPWAIHAFVELADADPEYAMSATLHAEALLHNALVRTGRADRFSACLLLDASRALAEPPLWGSDDQKHEGDA